MASNKILLMIVILFLQLTFVAKAQYQTNISKVGADNYLNPIFAGDYTDPSILRDYIGVVRAADLLSVH